MPAAALMTFHISTLQTGLKTCVIAVALISRTEVADSCSHIP